MKHLVTDRRTFIAFVGIIALTVIGVSKGADVAMWIASISGVLSAVNAAQAVKGPKA